MRLALVVLTALSLAGCSIPSISFQDSNESILAVEVRLEVSRLNCEADTAEEQVDAIRRSVDLLQLYSDSKGSKDLQEMALLMKDTTDSFYTRSLSGMSVVYCNMKKNALAEQSKTIAHAVMRRF